MLQPCTVAQLLQGCSRRSAQRLSPCRYDVSLCSAWNLRWVLPYPLCLLHRPNSLSLALAQRLLLDLCTA